MLANIVCVQEIWKYTCIDQIHFYYHVQYSLSILFESSHACVYHSGPFGILDAREVSEVLITVPLYVTLFSFLPQHALKACGGQSAESHVTAATGGHV